VAPKPARPISEAVDDYLKALLELGGADERQVTSNKLAERLEVRAASVTGMLQKLASHTPPLVHYEKHHGARLTAAGKRRAWELVRHHRLLERFLHDVLKYSWDEVHEEAERLEHFISERFEDRVAAILGDPEVDPHGHLIPPKHESGCFPEEVPLLDWSLGAPGRVSSVNDKDSLALRDLERLGLRPGVIVVVERKQPSLLLRLARQGSPGKLRGRKGWSYEGGVREPFIARFPGRISASSRRGGMSAGRLSNSVATTMDLMPTIAALCGAPLPTGNGPLDGVNIWPVLAEQQADVTHPIFLYFDGWNMQCARMGDWKLHVSRYNTFAWSPDPVGGRVNLPLPNPELYNLARDPEESYDCAADFPEIVAQIQAGIQQMLPTFPPQVLSTYRATMAIQSFATDGALPVELAPSPQ
jgi:DtxR family transcriptional regulator, Mn-dependent transcriptional regulator